jgi:hypothetical protein
LRVAWPRGNLMEENRDGGGGYAVRSGCGAVVERLWSGCGAVVERLWRGCGAVVERWWTGCGAVVDRLWSGHNYSHYYCQLTTVIVLVYLCVDLK